MARALRPPGPIGSRTIRLGAWRCHPTSFAPVMAHPPPPARPSAHPPIGPPAHRPHRPHRRLRLRPRRPTGLSPCAGSPSPHLRPHRRPTRLRCLATGVIATCAFRALAGALRCAQRRAGTNPPQPPTVVRAGAHVACRCGATHGTVGGPLEISPCAAPGMNMTRSWPDADAPRSMWRPSAATESSWLEPAQRYERRGSRGGLRRNVLGGEPGSGGCR